MGDAHVGLQARLISQALLKLTVNLTRSNTIAYNYNPLRERIGVINASPDVTRREGRSNFYSAVRLDIRMNRSHARRRRGSIGNRATRVKGG